MKRLGWIIFFLLVIYFIFTIRQDIIDYLELKNEAQSVEKKFKQEETAAQRLNERLIRLKQGTLVEELARTRLGLIKKDETAYKVIDGK